MTQSTGMFDKVLIANRGEIACRIARSCAAMGVRTVAVYSDVDVDAAHVAACDEARRLGPAAASESYLDIGKILEAARDSGAEAIHPGYGFLSENARFAEACAEAGVVFIGPPVPAIKSMGSKSAAKAIMAEAGVPLVPGYYGEDQSLERLESEARAIGFPVLIKASAGGGGKGMRRVDEAGKFAEALAAAKREAKGAFGDDHVLIERCLIAPRHIEVQVFADTHGNVVHLFERDCSIQRRHQKIVEEAPAPHLDPQRREEMGRAAVAAAQAIGYVGAGTVEFIADTDGRFYFMEMNTRLQVEHPVTEFITRQDLVEWQLEVAAGRALPLRQNELAIHGHAMEARIYAEDPARDFLPAIGRIEDLRLPESGPNVRIDIGVRAGDAVSVHYDPMIAKLIVWDQNRSGAVRRLQRALGRFRVQGVVTNVDFLARVARQPEFAEGKVHTGFIEEHRAHLLPEPQASPDEVLAFAALSELQRIDREGLERAQESNDPYSPWHVTSGWRLNSDNFHAFHFRDAVGDTQVVAHYGDENYRLDLPGGTVEARVSQTAAGDLRAVLGGKQITATVLGSGERITVVLDGLAYELERYNPLTAGMEAALPAGTLTAPMPGTVTHVYVAEGEAVEEGQALMVLEAMKMEHTIAANGAGVVAKVNFAAGETVSEGAELLSIEAAVTG